MKPRILLTVLIPVLLLAMPACGGNGPLAGLSATDTPTPTITPSPTPTRTPTPTITPSPTFTPTATPPPTGVKSEIQADQSIVFTDYDNKFQLTLPKGWIVIPVTKDDLSTIIDMASDANPQLADSLDALKSLDPNTIRLVAFNEDPNYFQSGFATNLTVTALSDKLLSAMPIAFVTGALEETFKNAGAKVLTSGENIIQGTDGQDIGIIEVEQSIQTASDNTATVYSKYIIFQVEGKMIMIQLATLKQFSGELGAVPDEIAKTIKLLKP